MKRRRFGVVVLSFGVVAALVAAFAWLYWPQAGSPSAPRSQSAAAPGADSGSGAVSVPIVLEDLPVDPPAGGFPVGEPGDGGTDAGQDQGQDVDQGDGQDVDPGDGQDDGQGGDQGEPPADPCPDAGGRLAVTPDPLTLPAGATSGSVTIHNCGAESRDWTSATKPWVELAADHGTLGAGETHELGFTVDDSAQEPGDYTFKIKVSEPGHNVYVDVNATKSAEKPGLATEPAGCGTGCITKAWLTPRHGTPDVGLEVRTSVSAKVFVELGTQPPSHDDQGRPYLPKAELKFSTDHKFGIRWDTVLTPLQPGTGYHIIVVAVDQQGKRSTEHGRFTTTKPVTGLAGGAAGGCASNCVASAVLTPKPESADHTLTVRGHVPATFAVYVSEQAPQVGGDPTAASDQPSTEWTTELDLAYGTTYRIVLRAVDEQSRTQFKQGQFTTPDEPEHEHDVLVTFHKIHVSDSADGALRGEMRFEFEVGGVQHAEIAVGERKVNAPEWIDLDRGDRGVGRSVAAYAVGDHLPIRVQAWERDRHDDDFGWQFCDRGSQMFDEASGRVEFEECDIDIEWNTAAATIDLHPDTGGALPSCYGMDDGITGDVCAILEAGGADPSFRVYLTIDFIE